MTGLHRVPAVVVLAVGALLVSASVALVITGTPVGGETLVNVTVVGHQQNPAIALGANGEFMVVWESEGQDGDGYGVYARLYDSAGSPKGSEFRVNSETVGDQRYPSVAYDGSGNYIVAWQSFGDHWAQGQDTTIGVYTRTFDGTGTPSTAEDQLVNTETEGNQLAPCVAAASATKYVILWVDDIADGSGNGILGRRYSAGAQPPQILQINTYVTGSQSQPDVAVASDSSFVAVWCSDGQDGDMGGIYGQAFSTGGAPRGSEFRVNSWAVGNQSAPSITLNETDCYVVVWSSEGQDGDGSGIYCQVYDEEASPVGSEFRVNTHITGNQTQPAVVACPNGTFVAVWSSESQDGSGSGVYGHEFRTNGNPVGSEFKVNTYNSDNQTTPDLCSNSLGGYVVAWGSYLQDGDGMGVYFRRYVCSEIPEFSHLAIVVGSTAIILMLAMRRRATTNGS